MLFIFPKKNQKADEFIQQFLEKMIHVENTKLQEINYYFHNEEGDK